MALCTTAPFCIRPMRRSFPAMVASLATTRTGFRICEGMKYSRATKCQNRDLGFLSPNSSGELLHKEVKLGFVFRSTRVKSSFKEQGVAEESRERIPSLQRLILFSKPGCCLCDGLKEKLVDCEIVPGIGIQLEVRDITTNSEWWKSYQYEIPVLVRVRDDGTEEPLPRLSPRLSTEQVRKKIRMLLKSAA